MSYPRLAMLAALYTRFDLPGTSRLLRVAGVRDDSLWTDAPARTVRGKWDRCRRTVELSNWSERLTWFLRRYYELPPQLLLMAALRRGDRVVDIGANIGMITTLAAHRVGPTGRVTAFEPNPDCCRRITEVVESNALAHVDVRSCALSDEPGRLELTVPRVHTGYATLARVEETEEWSGYRRIEVDVLRGDDVLARGDRLDAIKIDVEGFESHVARGLRQTLSTHRPLLITEVAEQLLRQAGSSGEELFSLLRGHGYAAFVMHVARPRRLSRPRLSLKPVDDPASIDPLENNVAWVDPDGPMMRRIERLIRT
jgi:FkbM family methyltransferase